MYSFAYTFSFLSEDAILKAQIETAEAFSHTVYSRTNALSLVWSCGDPSKVIWDINWSGVSSETSIESTSKGLCVESMSSSSLIGSKISFSLMSSSSVNLLCGKVSLRWGVWGRPAKEHKVLSWPLAIRNAQLLQGIEPLHSALDVALVSLRTNKAIVGGVLACDILCGGARYVGSGLLKYEGMRCTSR